MNLAYIVFTAFLLIVLSAKTRSIVLCYKKGNYPKMKGEIVFFVLMVMVSVGILLSLNSTFSK